MATWRQKSTKLALGLMAIIWLGMPGLWSAGWAYAPAPAFEKGVKLYRAGQFSSAGRHFDQLTAQHPDDSRVLYYDAITQVQLKQYERARQLYLRIVNLDPYGPAAPLARKGLAYLPSSAQAPIGLDHPPQVAQTPTAKPSDFQTVEPMVGMRPDDAPRDSRAYASRAPVAGLVGSAPVVLPARPVVPEVAASPVKPTESGPTWMQSMQEKLHLSRDKSGPQPMKPSVAPAFSTAVTPAMVNPALSSPAGQTPTAINSSSMNPAMANPMAGMDPQAMQQQMQTMMMMQMMNGMSGGNNNGGNNMNWMMNPMMGGMGGGMNGMGGMGQMDPAVMKEMMMNQMMSGMSDLGGSSNKE